MTTDGCPRCGRPYERCNCGNELVRRQAPGGKVTALAVFRAAKKLQDMGLPITTGADRDWFPEKAINVGSRVNRLSNELESTEGDEDE